MQIVDCVQCDDQWFEIRDLKMTGSKATPIKANGAGLITYTRELVLDHFGLLEDKKNFENEDIRRGKELEPLARFAYEIETGYKVEEVGFCVYSDYVGVSPDGLILKRKAGIEVKAKNNKNHLALLDGDKIDSGTINQMQMIILVCDLDWMDFISFNPNFEKELFIKRVDPDKKAHEKLKAGFKSGEKMIKKTIERMGK